MPPSSESTNKATGLLTPDLRATTPVTNPANQANGLNIPGEILKGKITRTEAGYYDANVTCGDKQVTCHCLYLAQCLGYKAGFGTTEAKLFPEGTEVLIYRTDPSRGFILGAIPDSVATSIATKNVVTQLVACEGGVSSSTDAIFSLPKAEANNARAEDVMPGNYVLANEQEVTFAILNLMTLLKATERAKLELFILDDFVRLTSGQFQHSSAAWTQHVLSDYGYNTEEVAGSHHQCEMWGLTEYDQSFIAEDTYDITLNKNTRLKLVKEDLLQRNRYQTYLGHLGGLFNLFISNPDPNIPITTYAEKQIDQGLFQTHIDGSGRLLIRSAAGICLQRTDKISVPKKLKEAWDPGGHKVDEEDPFEEKKAFEWSKTYPYAQHLQMRDAHAWYVKASYQRFIELNQDWFLPDELALKPLINDYDKIGDKKYGNETFTEQEGKKNSLSMELDGSIIIRDAWGSEIIMKGGNITISCPGNLELRPGKSIVALGGHDVIIKGRKSVDITATENDVRIKAEKNLHLHSSDGGILVESDSPERGQNYKDMTGEQIVSSGIVLKAKKARVFIWADVIHLGFISNLFLEAYNSTKGTISLLADKITTIATNQISMFTTNAGLLINKVDSVIFGTGAYVFGKNSAAMIKGTKFLAPMLEADIKKNPYNDIQDKTIEFYDQLWSDGTADDILGPYNIETREDIQFKFRDDSEYGTMEATEVYEGGVNFVIYETSWSFLKEGASDFKFIEGDIARWKEKEVNKTYPWPGKQAYKGNCLVYLVNEQNIEQDISKAYKEVTSKSGILKTRSMHELTVMDV